MKIRLIGTPFEVADACLSIRALAIITAFHGPYPARRDPAHVCLYLEVTSLLRPVPHPDAPAETSAAHRGCTRPDCLTCQSWTYETRTFRRPRTEG
ncbi:hypothetical protein [Streptosporangium lutulentum]|uniref:Uncharacterized protein n=1 Tax=Streptosporangium lutulentum TaxID=1461250 RepID=A0ABT9QP24_9ACTN|nr:hypothetical protein [Streptosporangium lutulentum]MDP9847998.1 hypothetical protein [Streptosporangium lutulentum]